ncbi:hypothetical protein [Providencia rettgeri]|uniref:phage tail fiber protein n=1 Tax=Providencia rettgeri TaxID=587 RepID=UPI001E5F8B33|nr:hypothetical protein [Providencia rettgeri]
MYNTGTVTTTANSTKVTGTNTKWKDNNSLVSAEQVILIQNGTTVYINSIASIQSDTELTLSFAAPAAVKNGSYRILTTMVNSISDAANKLVAMNNANAVFSEVLNRMFTETGIITVVLPDGTTLKTKTFAEMDKQLDGKFDKAGGQFNVDGEGVALRNISDARGLTLGFRDKGNILRGYLGFPSELNRLSLVNSKTGKSLSLLEDGRLTYDGNAVMQVGNYGIGGSENGGFLGSVKNFGKNKVGFFSAVHTIEGMSDVGITDFYGSSIVTKYSNGDNNQILLLANYGINWLQIIRKGGTNTIPEKCNVWTDRNTTKDSNGNLKAASPVVKLFADDIDLNEESEGVEMEHLGVGHYLIKGVVGFNADGAWGINNGFVIPQDHNGKNMVLIDYEVRPDGDIEVFVFHQQNADMPERFQNKRIKHFDEEGVPVYFENYEPCDVPESRWIDMRVEMPPNSTYNQKQAEAERLAKLEAERLAQEEAKRAAEEAERAE